MGVFIGKKGRGKARQAAAEGGGPVVKKPQDAMSSVIKESVAETVVSADFKPNKAFTATYGGRPYYIGLWLSASEIGGLSAASKRDEAKGSFIEQVNGGTISALATKELISRESMVLAPSRENLEALREYEMLRRLKFPLCYIWDDGREIEITDADATLDGCLELLESGGSAQEAWLAGMPPGATEEAYASLGAEDAEAEDAGDQEEEMLAPSDPEPAAAPGGGAGLDADDARPEDDSLPDGDGTYDEPFGDGGDDEPFDEDDVEFGSSRLGYDQGADEDEEDYVEDVSEDLYERTLTRRLSEGDLDLEISTDAFDMAFLHRYAPPLFDARRPKGWLSDQLDDMCRRFNAEIRKMHQDAQMRCRSEYFQLMEKACIDIEAALEHTDPETAFGKKYRGILEKAKEDGEGLGTKVAERKKEIEAAFEAEVSREREAAALQADQAYRRQHERQHRDRIYRLEGEVKAENDAAADAMLRALHEERRIEARRRLEAMSASVMAKIAERYEAEIARETARRAEMDAELKAFAESARADEMTRANILDREMRETDKAAAVMAEYSAKLEAQRLSYESQASLLAADLERTQKRHQEEMDASRVRHQSEIQGLRDQLSSARGEADVLRGQIAHMDEVKDKQYEARINELAGEREAFSRKYEHLADLQKKTGGIIVVAAVVGIVAALAVGFAAGMFSMKGESGAKNIKLPAGYELVETADGMEVQPIGDGSADSPQE